MVPLQRARYRIPTFLALGICLLLLSSLPPHGLQAASKQQVINNAIADFKDGQFQRASLTNALRINPNDKVADQVGGVQLGPVGLLKNWVPNPNTPLPKKLFSLGATAIGNRIFVIGGRSPNVTGSVPVADVSSITVSTIDGAPNSTTGWQAEPSLPAVQQSSQTTPSPQFASPIAPIVSPAVVSTSDAAGLNGFIYVIGGAVTLGTFEFSGYSVRIGTVANGRISGWAEQPGARLPSGVQQAGAATAQINGVTYVYLIGGLQETVDSQGRTSLTPLDTTYYARVGSGGKLFKPSSPGTEGWDVDTQHLPVALYDATAVSDNFVASTQSAANAIYLVGGQLTPETQSQAATFSPNVYRALINNDGSLNWGGWSGLLFESRSQAAGVAFRGNLYLTGGATNGKDAEDVALTSYVEDDLTLHQFASPPPGVDGDGTNFLQTDKTASHPLTKPRRLHASVLVRAGSTSTSSAFLYVLGGIGAQDADTSDDNGSDTVLYGKIGGSEDVSSTGYASDGWYYGLPVDVAQQFTQVQVQEIDWTSVISSSNMDVALEYRLSSSNDCTKATWSEWIPLDGDTSTPNAAPFSVNGQNAATIVDPSSRCFQYRARLSTQNALATPLLLNVSVKVNIPGNPDLSPKTVAPLYGAKNAFLGMNVVIQNVNTVDPPTLAADVEKQGSFFVDICIFKPGVTVTPPTYPLTEQHPPACSTAYANVNRSFMPANAQYTITQWLDSGTNKAVNLLSYFDQVGTYTVIVVVDSFGYVDEGVNGGEANNIGQQVTFQVAARGYQLSLPVVRK